MFAVACGSSQTHQITLYSNDHEAVGSLDGHEGIVRCLIFSKNDSKYLLSGSNDCTARIWDTTELRCVSSIPHPRPVWNVCFGNGDEFVISLDEDGVIRKWVLAGVAAAWELRTNYLYDSCCCLFLDNTRVISCGGDAESFLDDEGCLTVWDMEVPAENPNCELQRCSFLARVFSISPSGDSITVGLTDGSVLMYSVDTRVMEDDPRLLRSCSSDEPVGIDYTTDSTRVLCGTAGGCIFVWEVGSGSLLNSTDADFSLYAKRICFDATGENVVWVFYPPKSAIMMNINSGQTLLSVPLATAAAFSRPSASILL